MKKIISFLLGCFVALNLSVTAANSAANEVRVAYFLEWPSPNLEDMQKKAFAKALGVPVKWTNFSNGGFSVASPTAGLHFTNDLIERLKKDGHEFVYINLDVNIDTFKPVTSEYLEHHNIHEEKYQNY